PVIIDAATITPTVVTSHRNMKCRMADGRRTPARCATIALQNPLARPPHAVFGLKTFIDKTTVPRKPKTSVETKPPDATASAANGKTSAPETKKKSRVANAPAKKKKAAPPKKPRAKAPGKTAAEPTDDQIRLRAYFLAEHRHKLSLPGDSNHDWIEARRQLLEES